MTSANHLRLEPRASTCLIAFLLISHALALLGLVLTGIILSIKLVATVLILSNLAWLWRVFVLMNMRQSVCCAEWLGNDEWHITDGTGTSGIAKEWSANRSFSFVTILNFNISGQGRRTMLLCKDSIDAELLRKLKVRLNQSVRGT